MGKHSNNNGDNATRSLFSFGLLGILNAIIMLSPIDPDTQVKLAATLNPTIGLVSFVLYRVWDRYMGDGQ